MITRSSTRDAAALASLHGRAAPLAWDQFAFERLLGDPAVLALHDEAGFVLVRTAADEAEILMIAVVPEARQRGRARALLEAAITRLSASQATQLFLEVADDNLPALALYQSTGFEAVGRRAGYYRAGRDQPCDAIVMRRSVGGVA